jgi:hypothetical protein
MTTREKYHHHNRPEGYTERDRHNRPGTATTNMNQMNSKSSRVIIKTLVVSTFCVVGIMTMVIAHHQYQPLINAKSIVS